MISLNFPKYKFRVKQEKGSLKIWDRIRKKFVALTPEEWVRQHAIEFLIQEKKYPPLLIQVEKQLSKNMQNRTDIIVFDKSYCPYLLVECKRPKATNHLIALEQIAKYNALIKAKYVMITNGLVHYFAEIRGAQAVFKESIPNYRA